LHIETNKDSNPDHRLPPPFLSGILVIVPDVLTVIRVCVAICRSLDGVILRELLDKILRQGKYSAGKNVPSHKFYFWVCTFLKHFFQTQEKEFLLAEIISKYFLYSL